MMDQSKVLDFVIKNPAVSTTVAVFASSALTLSFLLGYMSAFDVKIAWIVEYSDVLKFIIISGFVTIFLIITLAWATFSVFSSVNEALDNHKVLFISLLVLLSGAVIVFVLYKYDYFEYYLYSHLTKILAIILLLIFMQTYYKFHKSNMLPPGASRRSVPLAAMLIALPFLFGSMIGDTVKFKGEYKTTVKTKDKIYRDVVTIMLLSHHSIFYNSANEIIILPAEQIESITVERGE